MKIFNVIKIVDRETIDDMKNSEAKDPEENAYGREYC